MFLLYSIFKVTTLKPSTIWKQMSTFRSTLKTESSSLASNENKSESLNEQSWNVDFLTMPELFFQGFSIGQSIKIFIEEKVNGRQKYCLKF